MIHPRLIHLYKYYIKFLLLLQVCVCMKTVQVVPRHAVVEKKSFDIHGREVKTESLSDKRIIY